MKSLVQGEYLRLQHLKSVQQKSLAAASPRKNPSPVATPPKEEESAGKKKPAKQGEKSGLRSTSLSQEAHNSSGARASPAGKIPSTAGKAKASGKASPQLTSASFTPRQGLLGSFGVVGGAPTQPLLEELPVKPFFFASVDLIGHFLAHRDEKLASLVSASSGESRPAADQVDSQARSGSQ